MRTARSCPVSWRFAFTITELAISAVILTLLFGAVIEFFFKGNKMAAKGVWRTACVHELRLAFRQVHQIISAANYPTQATTYSMVELSNDEDYRLTISANQSSQSTSQGNLSAFDFKAKSTDYEILHVWNFQPITSSPPPGGCRYARLSLMLKKEGGMSAAPGNRSLVLVTEEGTYTISGADSSNPSCTTTKKSETVKTLVRDVDTVRILVPAADETQGGLFGIEITCRDPGDGQLTQNDALRVEKTVAVKKTS